MIKAKTLLATLVKARSMVQIIKDNEGRSEGMKGQRIAINLVNSMLDMN